MKALSIISRLTLLAATIFSIWDGTSTGLKTLATALLFWFIVNHYKHKEEKAKEERLTWAERLEKKAAENAAEEIKRRARDN